MFDQLKKIQQLRELQNSLKKEKSTAEKNGVKVVMNGGFEIVEIKLNPELGTEEQERILKECINEARESVQKIAAKTMMASNLSGMF